MSQEVPNCKSVRQRYWYVPSSYHSAYTFICLSSLTHITYSIARYLSHCIIGTNIREVKFTHLESIVLTDHR